MAGGRGGARPPPPPRAARAPPPPPTAGRPPPPHPPPRTSPDLHLGAAVDEVAAPPDPAAFLRDYVGPNKPLIVRGGAAHWPARRRWTAGYLAAAAGGAEVTVDVTPNGRGDAVTRLGATGAVGRGQKERAQPAGWVQRSHPPLRPFPPCSHLAVRPDGSETLCFCTPHQRMMHFAEFLDFFFATKAGQQQQQQAGGQQQAGAQQQQAGEQHQAAERQHAGEQQTREQARAQRPGEAQRPEDEGGGSAGAPPVEVPYLQHQNSNLTQQLPSLLPDVEAQLPWAAAALGAGPDAVNLWIGDGRAATTYHKDAYENIYCMVAGTKVGVDGCRGTDPYWAQQGLLGKERAA
jgi:jumonji domain-containing protein 7